MAWRGPLAGAPPAAFPPALRRPRHRPPPTQINAARAAAGERPFDSARNAAAGSLRLLDPSEAAARRLSFVGYQLLVPGAAGGGSKVRRRTGRRRGTRRGKA
jgi:hypothetical protein